MHADLGGRIPHIDVPQDDALVSTLDMLGPGYTLFTGGEWNDADAARIGRGAPVRVRQLDPVVARALGVHGGGTLLVRPDGVPAAA
jgi:hypothetical protein